MACWLESAPAPWALSGHVRMHAGAAMTHIEKMRMQAALQALSGTHACNLHSSLGLMLAADLANAEEAKGTE